MAPDPTQILIAALLQRQNGETNVTFANRLGVHHTHWWHVKRGERRVGMKLSRGIIRCYPELWREVQDVLLPVSSRNGEGAA